ncbi:ADP-ribose glycohydrolase MACROD2 isoform X3 [Poecile atricapillus]|uniref:ADP-ribose glycohydrolase MACROD2 isoform X3 n=1 Tax=Poecile atricapillus TaxID=48891 RepID=UPI0027384D32|nr:ADP-ribose glycohydrolase MACROD2 isoform X3 [Poecile atricapillus]
MYPGNKRKKLWREEKERLLKMTLEERRKEYQGDYVALKTIPTWMEDLKSKSESEGENTKEDLQGKKSLSEKVSLYRGDITLLEVDAIVNAANSSLLGGGGDVIHTVGPIARGHLTDTHKENLASCYKSSLKLAKENNIRSIAFPCISTGIYGFPNEPAAVIALSTIKEWLSKNHNEVDRIIFCVFLEVDYKIFKKKMGEFFPLGDANEEEAQLNEEREGLSPSPTKSKEEQPEDLQDDAEGGNDAADKQNTDESKTQSQEAGETKASSVASLSSEDIELSENKDSLKDSKVMQKGDSVDPVMCEQDQAKGEQDISANEEIKSGEDSQGSCMEIEDPLLNQEDKTEVEKPLILGAEEKEEGKEEEGGIQEQEESPVEPMKIDLASQAADVSNKDAEMNSQVESINDPMETERKA